MAVTVVRPGSSTADITHPTGSWVQLEDGHLKVGRGAGVRAEVIAIYSPSAWIRTEVSTD